MKIDKVFSDGESQVSYEYPSPMCDEVHKGVIKVEKGRITHCIDMCITLDMALKEIKELGEMK